jgi:hypothetical protein
LSTDAGSAQRQFLLYFDTGLNINLCIDSGHDADLALFEGKSFLISGNMNDFVGDLS